MSVTKKTTHVTDAPTRLAEQFKGQANVEAVVGVFAQQAQEIEDALFEIFDESMLSTAVGVQLDGFGSIVGEERQGRLDDDYRLAISSRISLNLTSGTAEQVIKLVQGLIFDSQTIEISEDFPAAFFVIIPEKLDVDGAGVSTFVQSAKPAGVRAIFWWFETDTPFGFLGDADAFPFGTGEFASAHDF